MFEEFYQALRFLTQAGLVVACASCLWGMVFSFRAKRNAEKRNDLNELSRLLFMLFFIGAITFFTFWWATYLIFFAPEISAHEGIVIKPIFEEIRRGFSINFPLVIISLALTLFGAWAYTKKQFVKYALPFFLTQFMVLSSIILLSNIGDYLDNKQFFFFLHSWHSVITLATVIVTDFLYIATFNKDNLKRIVYPFFPVISAAIWIGLGLDFLSVFLILPEALNINTQFFFNQTVIVILVINGALLSGKINDKLTSLIKPDKVLQLSPKANLIFGISGSISIVSWLTITFLDYFSFQVSYFTFFAFYIAIIIAAFFSQKIAKHFIMQTHEYPVIS